MRTRYVGPVHLPTDLFQRLEQQARTQERDTLQQARWLLRQALTEQRQPERVPVAAGDAQQPGREA